MSVQEIALDRIDPNPDQPRKTFKAESLADLAASIRTAGLQQPIKLRPKGDRFEIVMGERRFRAHVLNRDRHGGPGTIRAHVEAMSDKARDIAAVVENLAREDVPPLEEAHAFYRLIEIYGMSEEDLATALGVVPFRIRWRLSLLNLDEGIQKLVAAEQIDRQTALELSRLPRQEDQRKVLQMINSGRIAGWGAVRTTVNTILSGASQEELFGASTPKPEASELAAVKGMEKRIQSVVGMVAGGWKDNECVIAGKIAPDRAATMADMIAEIQRALRLMEKELRRVTAARLAFDAGAEGLLPIPPLKAGRPCPAPRRDASPDPTLPSMPGTAPASRAASPT